jgi:D-alanyl-D-alanine carboxypeptidase
MSAADAQAIDDAAAAALAAAPDLPGMWIGVWDPEKGVHIGAYGDAVAGQTAATPEDHSRIGSVTKTFTATAVLEQVAGGELALDETIEEVLPDLAETYPDLAPITVEQLLAMRSGIPDYANTGAVTGPVVEDPTKVWTVDEIIATTLEEEPLQPPGTPGYSTTNYLILGEMLEAVTGEPVEQVINGVAEEAGLSDTALQEPEETQMPDPSSHGYLNDPGVQSLAEAGITAEPGQDVTDWTVSWGQAGGGMYSTVADMGTWAATGLGNTLLPADLGDQRLQTQPIPEGDYGLGIFDWGNGWIGHTGQLIGWESLVAYNTDTGAVFVGMVNETGSLTAAIGVAYAVFPDLVEGLVSG